MAERRMFAKSITNSARFLMMPVSSRLLYYDLGMAADDDGIVEAFTVMRTSGVTEDDLRVLASKGFVTVLTEEFVTYINDWKLNNFVRGDRYKPSIYKELLVKLQAPETDGIPDDNQWYTEGTPRLGKDRLGKDSIGEGVSSLKDYREPEPKPDTPTQGEGCIPPSLEEVAAYCREIQSTVSAQTFHSHYAGNGWAVNGIPLHDWRAKLRYWDAKDREKGKTTLPENRPGYAAEPDPLDGLF